MLSDATGYHPDYEDGRWVIETRRGKRPWEVVVEPIRDESVLLVVTANSRG